MAAITHRIDDGLKAELDRFCAEHGFKQQAVVSEAIAGQRREVYVRLLRRR